MKSVVSIYLTLSLSTKRFSLMTTLRTIIVATNQLIMRIFYSHGFPGRYAVFPFLIYKWTCAFNVLVVAFPNCLFCPEVITPHQRLFRDFWDIRGLFLSFMKNQLIKFFWFFTLSQSNKFLKLIEMIFFGESLVSRFSGQMGSKWGQNEVKFYEKLAPWVF